MRDLLQSVVFLTVTLLAFGFFRPMVKRRFPKLSDGTSGMAALLLSLVVAIFLFLLIYPHGWSR